MEIVSIHFLPLHISIVRPKNNIVLRSYISKTRKQRIQDVRLMYFVSSITTTSFNKQLLMIQ
ncbi:hypothetical protein CI610_03119 [invertebrate metagenome]|uniref:Uncharacterized protein n=1 Tax=invertebrate metagenome TaxID=1711999 RepID=A0A2H9T412_9ZZZZ